MKRAGLARAASLALGLVAVFGSGLAADRAAAAARGCVGPVLRGSSERAAESTVEVFLRTVVVTPRSRPCRAASLAVAGLAPARYPTRRLGSASGGYQLAPRIRNQRGYWEYAGFLYVDAPDAAPAAFEFLLELHGRRWLVSRFAIAPGSTDVDFANAPT